MCVRMLSGLLLFLCVNFKDLRDRYYYEKKKIWQDWDHHNINKNPTPFLFQCHLRCLKLRPIHPGCITDTPWQGSLVQAPPTGSWPHSRSNPDPGPIVSDLGQAWTQPQSIPTSIRTTTTRTTITPWSGVCLPHRRRRSGIPRWWRQSSSPPQPTSVSASSC